MKTLLFVYGTRPEAIKVAPLIRDLQDDSRFRVVTAVTGQHREMLDQVNRIFEIEPEFDLDIFQEGQGLNQIASRIIERIDPIYDEVAPDAVVVQGDTSTVMASAIAAFNRRIPVIHLEAGLRSHDINSPFPEEANRKIVTQVAALHLAPTSTSRLNLEREGVPAESIAVTGNTVIDALLHAVDSSVEWSSAELSAAIASGRRILLVTTHRRENWGGAMENVGRALKRISETFPEDLILLPAHRNPVVRRSVLPAIAGAPNVILTEPLAYQEFIHLLNASHLVLTDSGGVQEEAPSLGKPVLVMRENTERPEAVESGTVRLIGTDEDRIVQEVSTLKSNREAFLDMARAVNPYGDGKASERSSAAIAELLGVGSRMPDF